MKKATASPSFSKEWWAQDIVVNLFCGEVVIPYQYLSKMQDSDHFKEIA
jgi:hypothetical protein